MSDEDQPLHSCSVSINPDQIVCRNFDKSQDPDLALAVFRQKQGELEAQKRGPKPKTDRFLTECDKKIKLLQHAIDQIQANLPCNKPSTSYPRKEKRQLKALRRKTDRLEQERKNSLQK
jgi:hypothetical protein